MIVKEGSQFDDKCPVCGSKIGNRRLYCYDCKNSICDSCSSGRHTWVCKFCKPTFDLNIYKFYNGIFFGYYITNHRYSHNLMSFILNLLGDFDASMIVNFKDNDVKFCSPSDIDNMLYCYRKKDGCNPIFNYMDDHVQEFFKSFENRDSLPDFLLGSRVKGSFECIFRFSGDCL